MALAFDLILLCERERGCWGRPSREREDERCPCSKVIGDRSEGSCGCASLAEDDEPTRDEMKVA